MKKLCIIWVVFGLAVSSWAATDEDKKVMEVMGLAISISFTDTKPEYFHSHQDLSDMFNDPEYRDNPSNRAQNNGSLWK